MSLPIVDKIRDIARSYGWAIGEHGSMVRDIDLIGVPWVKGAATSEMLVKLIMEYTKYTSKGYVLSAPRPGGRVSILLFHPDAVYSSEDPKGKWDPPAIDLSLFPMHEV